MKPADLEEERIYRDGIGNLRCGRCLRPLMTMTDRTLVTLPVDDLVKVLQTLRSSSKLASAMIEKILADLPEPFVNHDET